MTDEAAAELARLLLTKKVGVVHGAQAGRRCPWCGTTVGKFNHTFNGDAYDEFWCSRRENAETPENDGFTYVGCWRFVEEGR